MKLILETQELEAIVKENIAAKYPDNNISVSIQNKRNGIEVTVVLTEKLAEKEVDCFVDDEEYAPEEEILKQVITISPHDYRETEEVDEEETEEEINEMRERAGLEVKAIHTDKQDADIKAFKSMAGL